MSRFEELTPDEFAEALAAAPHPFLLDVRDAAEFQTAHIPGSEWIQVHELAQRRGELPVNRVRRILVVGDGATRTKAAATWLVLTGYADVGALAGGFAAWKGPTETGPPPPKKPPGPQLRVI